MCVEIKRRVPYNAIQNCRNASTAEYTYHLNVDNINCNADIYFSGCGDETEQFDIPLDIILLNDKEWENYLEATRREIEMKNEEYETAQEKLKEKNTLRKMVEIEAQKRAKYEELKREFGD